jgi:hypothetical protein
MSPRVRTPVASVGEGKKVQLDIRGRDGDADPIIGRVVTARKRFRSGKTRMFVVETPGGDEYEVQVSGSSSVLVYRRGPGRQLVGRLDTVYLP